MYLVAASCSVVVEARRQALHAAAQAVDQRRALRGRQVEEYLLLEGADHRGQVVEQPVARVRERGAQDPLVAGIGLTLDEATALERRDDLVHRLRGDERAAGELSVRQPRPRAQDRQRGVL